MGVFTKTSFKNLKILNLRANHIKDITSLEKVPFNKLIEIDINIVFNTLRLLFNI